MDKCICYKKYGYIFFEKHKIISKNKLLRKLGAKKNTFAGNMVCRLYNIYFAGSTNLKKEYRKYYKNEFDTITQFIESHYNIDHQDAEYLSKKDYSIKDYSWKTNLEISLDPLMYDEYFNQMFFKAIGEIKDEDTNWIYNE